MSVLDGSSQILGCPLQRDSKRDLDPFIVALFFTYTVSLKVRSSPKLPFFGAFTSPATTSTTLTSIR